MEKERKSKDYYWLGFFFFLSLTPITDAVGFFGIGASSSSSSSFSSSCLPENISSLREEGLSGKGKKWNHAGVSSSSSLICFLCVAHSLCFPRKPYKVFQKSFYHISVPTVCSYLPPLPPPPQSLRGQCRRRHCPQWHCPPPPPLHQLIPPHGRVPRGHPPR